MLKKNLVKILILTLKMCDLANKQAPTAASPSVANSWQNISASLVIKFGLCVKIFSPSKMNFLGLFCLINLDKIRSQNIFAPISFQRFLSYAAEFLAKCQPRAGHNRFCRESAAQMTTIGNSFLENRR
jgi:hypothetical protein